MDISRRLLLVGGGGGVMLWEGASFVFGLIWAGGFVCNGAIFRDYCGWNIALWQKLWLLIFRFHNRVCSCQLHFLPSIAL